MKHAKLGAILGAVLVLASGSWCWSAEPGAPMTEAERQALAKDVARLNEQAKPFTELFTKTIELVLPSVVSVTTTRTVRVPATTFELPLPFPFENPQAPQRPMRPRQRDRNESVSGLGCGFVVDAAKGYVATNAHVVRDVKAEHIKLIFQDGHEVTAEKVLIDPRTDVAVIKIAPDHLIALEWADKAPVTRGQWVLAVGSPMGFGGTVTSGIISAPSTRHRFFAGGRPGEFHANEDPYAIEDYVQTDAAINPGNSGGPLISLDGKVVGINTLIVTSSMTSSGLGFAVPERLAKPVVDSLIQTGHVVRGHLGVAIIEPAQIDDHAAWQLFGSKNADEVFNKYHIKKDDKGVVIGNLMPGGPADKAGIQEGDLIRAVGATPTPDVDTLRAVVAATKPGTAVDLTVVREGREKKISVTIGEQPSGAQDWAAAPGGGSTNEELGLSVQPITPEIADALGYAEDLKGLIVTDVIADSPAAKAHPAVQRNDVILEVNGEKVANIENFTAALRKGKKGNAALLIRRGDATQMIVLKLPK